MVVPNELIMLCWWWCDTCCISICCAYLHISICCVYFGAHCSNVIVLQEQTMGNDNHSKGKAQASSHHQPFVWVSIWSHAMVRAHGWSFLIDCNVILMMIWFISVLCIFTWLFRFNFSATFSVLSLLIQQYDNQLHNYLVFNAVNYTLL